MKADKRFLRNAGRNKITPPAIKVRYAAAAAARSAAGIGVIDHPQPGQKAALSGIRVPQCGHFTEWNEESGARSSCPPVGFDTELGVGSGVSSDKRRPFLFFGSRHSSQTP